MSSEADLKTYRFLSRNRKEHAVITEFPFDRQINALPDTHFAFRHSHQIKICSEFAAFPKRGSYRIPSSACNGSQGKGRPMFEARINSLPEKRRSNVFRLAG